MDNLSSLILSLSGKYGVSGCEASAAEAAKNELAKYMKVRSDALGSIIGETESGEISVLLDAHIDQIGMVVTEITDKGFIKVCKCGGMDARVLAAHEVIILGKEKVFGVVTSTPPHLKGDDDSNKAAKIEDIAIDAGLTKEQAQELISMGDRVVLKGAQNELLNGNISSPSLDDRCGVAAILRCLEILKDKKHRCKLTALFSVQEETGGSGARTGSFAANADISIAVDVSFARAPGIKAEESGTLTGGAMIGFSPVLDHELSRKLKQIAEDKGISHQIEAMGSRTGTNADSIQNSGAGTRMCLISIPLRNMHTGVEMINVADIEATAQLMAEFIQSL
ncbi:MAG: M20/M25/M40 family metallo-hydrolase [Clostridiales bacterium]|nr:M20/M25/M40 family metallo-hydrolase [Clostridiales bacterium]